MTKSNKEVLSESRGKVFAAALRPQPDKKGYFREQMHRLKKHRNIFWFVLPVFFQQGALFRGIGKGMDSQMVAVGVFGAPDGA